MSSKNQVFLGEREQRALLDFTMKANWSGRHSVQRLELLYLSYRNRVPPKNHRSRQASEMLVLVRAPLTGQTGVLYEQSMSLICENKFEPTAS